MIKKIIWKIIAKLLKVSKNNNKTDSLIIINKKLAQKISEIKKENNQRNSGINEAIILSALSAIKKEKKKNNNIREDGYFFTTVEELKEITTLSKNFQRTSIKNLKKFDLVTTDRKGLPSKRYFKINEEKILKFIGVNEFLNN